MFHTPAHKQPVQFFAQLPASQAQLIECIRSGQVDDARVAELLRDPKLAAAYAATK